MLLYYVVALAAVAVLMFCYGMFFAGNKKGSADFFKVASLAVFAALFVRLHSGYSYLENVYLLYQPELEYQWAVAVAVILDWATVAAVLMATFSSFFKVKHIKRMLAYFALPVAVLNLVFLQYALIGLTGETDFNFRNIIFALEQGLLIWVCLANIFEASKGELSLNGKNALVLVLSVAGCLFVTMPSHTLGAILGQGDVVSIKGFSEIHRIALYVSFIIPIVIYLLFRKKDMDLKKFVVFFICYGTFLTFSREFLFVDFKSPTSWPLHLCNTAMYIMPLCLTFKLKRLYYFTLFVNSLGALLAMLLPNYSDRAIYSISLYTFWINHMFAFFMPIVILGFAIFEKPKLKHFRYSIAGFALYFLAVLFINAWFTNYKPDIDYFFINSGFIASKLGRWAEDTRLITAVFHYKDLTFTFYPLYQALFFSIYIALSLAVWFVLEGGRDLAVTWGKLIAENKKALKGEREKRFSSTKN